MASDKKFTALKIAQICFGIVAFIIPCGTLSYLTANGRNALTGIIDTTRQAEQAIILSQTVNYSAVLLCFGALLENSQ